jgi:hypothetical protein
MYELHANEQYFFTPHTLDCLARFLETYPKVAVLCAPMLGRTLVERGRRVRILDIDDRFTSVDGFQHWNIHRPERLDERFDQPLLVSYLRRRSAAVLGTFARFGLEPTGFCPRYVTVQPDDRNDVEFFGNLGAERHRALVATRAVPGEP